MKPKNGKNAALSIVLGKWGRIVGWIGVALLVLFFIVPVIFRYFLHDPLSGPIRTKLNHMDAIGQEIKDLAGRAKKFNDTSALAEVQREYEEVKRNLNQVLQNAQESIQLNSIGENYHDLESALDKIDPGEVMLRDHLANISKPVTEAGLGVPLEWIWKLLSGAAQQWTELLKARAEMNRIAIDQLNRMKLPEWEKIPPYSGL